QEIVWNNVVKKGLDTDTVVLVILGSPGAPGGRCAPLTLQPPGEISLQPATAERNGASIFPQGQTLGRAISHKLDFRMIKPTPEQTPEEAAYSNFLWYTSSMLMSDETKSPSPPPAAPLPAPEDPWGAAAIYLDTNADQLKSMVLLHEVAGLGHLIQGLWGLTSSGTLSTDTLQDNGSVMINVGTDTRRELDPETYSNTNRHNKFRGAVVIPSPWLGPEVKVADSGAGVFDAGKLEYQKMSPAGASGVGPQDRHQMGALIWVAGPNAAADGPVEGSRDVVGPAARTLNAHAANNFDFFWKGETAAIRAAIDASIKEQWPTKTKRKLGLGEEGESEIVIDYKPIKLFIPVADAHDRWPLKSVKKTNRHGHRVVPLTAPARPRAEELRLDGYPAHTDLDPDFVAIQDDNIVLPASPPEIQSGRTSHKNDYDWDQWIWQVAGGPQAVMYEKMVDSILDEQVHVQVVQQVEDFTTTGASDAQPAEYTLKKRDFFESVYIIAPEDKGVPLGGAGEPLPAAGFWNPDAEKFDFAPEPVALVWRARDPKKPSTGGGGDGEQSRKLVQIKLSVGAAADFFDGRRFLGRKNLDIHHHPAPAISQQQLASGSERRLAYSYSSTDESRARAEPEMKLAYDRELQRLKKQILNKNSHVVCGVPTPQTLEAWAPSKALFSFLDSDYTRKIIQLGSMLHRASRTNDHKTTAA
ncbi:unnamed protein product, partial [Amoebophrya sp. A120]